MEDIVKLRNNYAEQGKFDAADEIIKTRFSESALEPAGVIGSDSYSTYLNSPGHRYSVINGLVEDVNDMQNGDQIVQ